MWKFEGWEGSRGLKCIIVPNCAAIGQTAAEIWRFFDFAYLAPTMTDLYTKTVSYILWMI